MVCSQKRGDRRHEQWTNNIIKVHVSGPRGSQDAQSATLLLKNTYQVKRVAELKIKSVLTAAFYNVMLVCLFACFFVCKCL